MADGADHTATGDGPAVTGSGGPLPGLTGRLKWVLVAAASWWIGLVVLAALAANPVTVSFVQLNASRCVVRATVLDVAAGRVRVEHHWPGSLDSPPAGEIVLGNIQDSFPAVEVDQRYLIPLVNGPANRLEVTIPKRGGRILGPPRVYPDTPDLVRQVESVLGSR